ncbi:hypothetical protein CI109_106769 [Kwoniella shandongensis]|uniref:Uncharacterized protein n=1 Tax=Kwoniella shandongensis TaxID=1734106 RepID=A0A5M6CBK1_9TREE|nr:uncharacterized protein CI109_000975 [Kwoniella shandongensis]KAA5530795.1 hypothetical protein CI109_000975 [Kwoniella shandongensis]
MSVELDPPTQLGFPRPLTVLVKRSLHIHNRNPHPVAFKVKTTAPRQYSVRPNSGRVEAGQTVEVQVLLQPLATEPPPHAKCKDKFLVQSAYISPDEELHSLGELWANIEKTNKAAINEQKIKVVYIAAEDGSSNANGIPEEGDEGTPAPGEASRIEDSHNAPGDGLTKWTTEPDKEYDPDLFRNAGFSYWELEKPIYKPVVAIFSHAQSSPSQSHTLPPAQDRPIPVPVEVLKPSPVSAPEPKSATLPPLGPSDVGVTNNALEQSLAATTSDSDKLSVALKEIDRLRAELEEARGPQVSGLRKRGGAAVSGAETAVEKAKEAVGVSGTQGVPLEVVVGLVVGVFVMTYLFF